MTAPEASRISAVDSQARQRPVGRCLLLAVAAVSTAVLVAVSPRHSLAALPFLAAATAACGVLAVLEQRRPRLGLRPVVAAIGLVIVVAVVTPPRASNDLWSYAMYGRIVSVHDANPYQRVPADFHSDPFFKRVSRTWRRRASVYGPVFVGYAAAGTLVAGDSPLATRLFFQLSAAGAVAGMLAFVWRRTRSPPALIWLGLHPLFGAVVNGGHNDAFVGLAVVAGVSLLSHRRFKVAGVVIGLCALVKLTGLLALLGMVIWVWRRRQPRQAITLAVVAGATVALGYLPFLGSGPRVLSGADHTVTPASLWNPITDWLIGHNAGRDLPTRLVSSDPTLSAVFHASVVLVAILALGLGWRAARARRPEPAVAAATASYTMAAEYTLPWYTAWALPVLSDRRPSMLAWVVWVQGAVILAAYRLPLDPSGGIVDAALRGVLTYAAPIVLVAAFAWAVIAA